MATTLQNGFEKPRARTVCHGVPHPPREGGGEADKRLASDPEKHHTNRNKLHQYALFLVSKSTELNIQGLDHRVQP